MRLIIETDGTIRCLYSEEIPLGALGAPRITRASHVEPDPTAPPGGAWTADLSPVRGPTLGPFPTRSAALAAEATWLEEHRLCPGQS